MSRSCKPAQANSAFHPSGIGKWGPSASAEKEKAGMVHSVSGWTREVQVKLWDPLRTRAMPYLFRFINPLEVCSRRCAIAYKSTFTLPLPYSQGPAKSAICKCRQQRTMNHTVATSQNLKSSCSHSLTLILAQATGWKPRRLQRSRNENLSTEAAAFHPASRHT